MRATHELTVNTLTRIALESENSEATKQEILEESAKALERCIAALSAYEASNCEAAKEARAALAKIKGLS